MIDVSKVADIVLLMIDGNFGFEMETMEFLNILSSSGMPGNVFGILTHLDLFRKPSTLQQAKKRLKHRFWSELYQGAKLFYLSGVINGRYPDREIHNLSRFISVMKNPRPLVWRNSHPYCLADRMLDLTPPTRIEEDPKCDRTIALYGYLRGTNLPAQGARVHIPGVGDLGVSLVEALPDPCPTPYMDQAIAKASGKTGRRRLGEKQKVLFAPMSDVGGVLVDKDAVYIDVKTTDFDDDQTPKDYGESLVIGLQGKRKLLGAADNGVRLFSGGDAVQDGRKDQRHANIIERNDTDSDEGFASGDSVETEEQSIAFADSDSDIDSDSDGAARWKTDLSENAERLHAISHSRTQDLAKLFYDDHFSPLEVLEKWQGVETEEVRHDDDFFQPTKDDIQEDRQIPRYDYAELSQRWTDQSELDVLRSKFTSASLLPDDPDSEGDGEFEDLEAEDPDVEVEAEREKNARRKEELKLRFEEEDQDKDEQDFDEDEWYDAQKAQIQKQLAINRTELDQLDVSSRLRVEGLRAGTYARIVLESVPHEFSSNFNPRNPVLIGGLSPTEDRYGFVQVRIKRHRWHKKILKTNDPLIFSLGWRRFQTLPVYSISDSRTRNRMLKYTPEHMHCFGTFYGPLVAPNTGFCCVQSLSTPGFRVAATGVVLNVDESTEIVKKLKLTGHPYKIFRNTAFIKDMFSTSLEIAKFEGASIRTVSGIRGQIKKALSKPEGHYRATFEDKVLMSDIVFLRAWYPVRPQRFYNPVTNLLDDWQAMRLTGAVRHDEGIHTPMQKNSTYRPIERATRHFNPLRVPRQLAADLPFKSQIAHMKPQNKETYMQKRAVVLGGEAKRARDLMQKLSTLRNVKVAKRRAAKEEKRKEYRKKVLENEEKREGRERKEKADYWQREGKKRKRDSV